MFTVHFEYTDIFNGEANYAWCRRATRQFADGTSEGTVVRSAKAFAGLSGVKCDRERIGDVIAIRPRGLLTVLYIMWEH
jgi:hypothetical protein